MAAAAKALSAIGSYCAKIVKWTMGIISREVTYNETVAVLLTSSPSCLLALMGGQDRAQ